MNLLITGAWQDAEEYISRIEAKGHQVQFLQYEKDVLPCPYEWVEGIIGNGIFLYHPIERFTNLRYIQLTSVGYDRVPMDYVQAHGIEIHNAKGVYSIPMAEFALAGVLNIYKQSRFFYENQKQHKWVKHRGLLELNGKTVAIIGCGDVGRECAKRFQAFGCQVIGLNRTVYENKYFDEIQPLSEIDAVLPVADIVIVAIALARETRYLINRERLAMLKNTAVLVNISRGAIVDTKALEESIGNIGGAVLDVFEEEPLGDGLLWDKGNIYITPHNSFVSDINTIRLGRLIMSKL